MQFKRIGVLTSGGDAPGMNAAIRSVVRTAIGRGVEEVYGIYSGYKGLIDDDMELLSIRSVSNIISRGGTMLYSARCPEFKTEEGMQKAVEVCKKRGIDGIVAIGGDGTFRGATDLTLRGIPCIGIPATIDNDISSTDYTIGFDTAMNTVVDWVDKLRDTCESHARCNVVEVMGKYAGDIALHTGIATGAISIAVRELPYDEDQAIKKIIKARENKKRNFIVIVAEGKENFAEAYAKRIEEKTGIETRFSRLAHVQRGGNPTVRDRVTASLMGKAAVMELLDGKSNLVICERQGVITSMDINKALKIDRMFKDLMTPEEYAELEAEGSLVEMRRHCEARAAAKLNLYRISQEICK